VKQIIVATECDIEIILFFDDVTKAFQSNFEEIGSN